MAMRTEQCVSSVEVPGDLRQDLIGCWVDVTNTGGAAGFPFPPVADSDVAPAVDRLVAELHPERCRIVTTVDGRGLLGWLVLRRRTDPLVAHRASVHHVQSHPSCRGEGVGAHLMHSAREIAREELGAEQLQLAARAGVGLESFYSRLGWKEIGRWPAALRLAPDDDRDEILMCLQPL